jgi:hypothetical protein
MSDDYPIGMLRKVWKEEADKRPRILKTIDQIIAHTDNPRILKVCNQYQLGLLTSVEVEYKIRELLRKEGRTL